MYIPVPLWLRCGAPPLQGCHMASVIGCPERVELLDAGRLLSILEGLLEYDYSDEQGFDDGHSAARGV